MHRRTFSNVPGLYPLDPSGRPPPSCDGKNISRHCQISPGVGGGTATSHLVEKHGSGSSETERALLGCGQGDHRFVGLVFKARGK